MDKTAIWEEAKQVDCLLLALGRHLLAVDRDPVAALPVAQLRVCGILYRGPRPMSALSRELGVSLSAMTQIADRLGRARLVSRVADGTDRRVRCLQLTRRGEEIMRRREDNRVRRVLAVLEHLSLRQRKQVLATLEMLTSACAAAHGPRAAAGRNHGRRGGSRRRVQRESRSATSASKAL
jgi:DNA-binding MarR family transcriptional regulator